jgi:hypothetical protein
LQRATTLPAGSGIALQQALDAAIGRANKVVSREPHLVTTFALGGEIETIEQEAADAAAAGDFDTHIALSAVVRRLKALIPIQR